jgi:NAD(P)-dependent dehydrogenase (short-subunit alcohol dehydrogenase family)
MAMILKDKVAIVTGGARGIGQEYSLGLVREGAKEVVADLLSCDETAAKVHKISPAGRNKSARLITLCDASALVFDVATNRL